MAEGLLIHLMDGDKELSNCYWDYYKYTYSALNILRDYIKVYRDIQNLNYKNKYLEVVKTIYGCSIRDLTDVSLSVLMSEAVGGGIWFDDETISALENTGNDEEKAIQIPLISCTHNGEISVSKNSIREAYDGIKSEIFFDIKTGKIDFRVCSSIKETDEKGYFEGSYLLNTGDRPVRTIDMTDDGLDITNFYEDDLEEVIEIWKNYDVIKFNDNIYVPLDD